MPRIKEIKETAPLWVKFNFLDVIAKLDKSKTNKYTPMLIRVLTDKINKTYQNQEDLKYIAEENGCKSGYLFAIKSIDEKFIGTLGLDFTKRKTKLDMESINHLQVHATALGGVLMSHLSK